MDFLLSMNNQKRRFLREAAFFVVWRSTFDPNSRDELAYAARLWVIIVCQQRAKLFRHD